MFLEIKPKRKEFKIFSYDSKEINHYLMIEKPDGKILKVSEDVKKLLDQMDGDTPLNCIQKKFEEILKIPIDSKKLEEILLHLLNKDLIEKDSIKNLFPESNSEEIKLQKPKGLRYSYYFPLFKERSCQFIGKIFSFLFSKYLFFIFLLGALTINLIAFFSPDSSIEPSIINMLLFFGILYVSMLFHEFGHIAASVRHGVIPKEAGVGFFLFFPVLYTDLNRVWRIDRMKRAQIDIGGIYLQLVFSALVVLLNLFYPLFDVKSFISLTLITLLMNLFPLLRWDGYWLLNDILGINNLNQRGKRFLKTIFKLKSSNLTSVDWNYGLNPKQKKIIPIYAIASSLYLILMFFSLIGIINSLIIQGTLLQKFINLISLISSLNIVGVILLIIDSISDIILIVFLYMMLKPLIKIVYVKIKKQMKHSQSQETK